MNILVISDSHGYNDQIRKVLEKEKTFDILFHLGDLQCWEDEIREMTDKPALMVAGNCDLFSSLPEHLVTNMEGHRLFLTHGNHHGVSGGTGRLVRETIRHNCDIVLYGHTHMPSIQETAAGILVLNPGSVTYPRQSGRKASYMLLELEKGKKPSARIKYLDESDWEEE